MTTIVSAFIANVNNYSLEKYITNGKELVNIPINKIIFIDQTLYDQFNEYKNEYTIFIPTTKADIYLYEYINQLTNFKLIADNNLKNTIDYIFVQCNKTEWLRKAIESNPFKSDNFIWVDFGIKHVLSSGILPFNVQNLKKNLDKVRIGHIWTLDPSFTCYVKIYEDIAWYFAGGVFGGDKKSIIKFADLVKEKCIEVIKIHKTLMWEVNIWYLVYKENNDLFSCYKCNHNDSLITNF